MNETIGTVDEEVIAEVVSKMTGVPLTRLEKEESERLLAMEDELHKTRDQPGRCRQVGRPGDPPVPIGSQGSSTPDGFVHLPRPVRRRQDASRQAARRVPVRRRRRPHQIDMSEYMEKHNVSRLVGAPPGYVGYEEGGQLTERIRRRPYSVVLLDEIEKAHPDVFNMLLQIMEEGRLTDSFGRHVDFKNVILIMTSNIGADMIKGGASFGFAKRSEVQDYDKMRTSLMSEIEKFFRPEFINRLDEVIVFRPLDRENLTSIIEFELSKVRERLEAKKMTLELDAAAKDFLIDKGYNPDFGARPLRRALSTYIEDPLAENLLSGEFMEGDAIKVTRKEEEDHLSFEATRSGGDDGDDGDGGDGDEDAPKSDAAGATSS